MIDGLPQPEWRVTGGMRVGPDSRVHTTFSHNPSTLRLASSGPNMQNIPHDDGLGRMVKEMFVTPPHFSFWERDFSAIEAVLVGYFAGDPTYIRFAKLGVHDYVASHMLGTPVDLSWSNADIKLAFKDIKRNHKSVRDVAKRIVHMSNYLGTPMRIHQLWPETFPSVKEAARLQSLYLDLFPSIRKWHKTTCERVDGTKQRRPLDGEEVGAWSLGVCYAQNPFSYVHRFYNVLDWEKVNGEWVSTFGEDAKRLIAFLPQSTAAAIIKKATRRMWYEYPWIGQTLRLLIHDSTLGEAHDSLVSDALIVSKSVMESEIEELPLDPTWNLGPFLTIGSEVKVGKCWADMEVVSE